MNFLFTFTATLLFIRFFQFRLMYIMSQIMWMIFVMSPMPFFTTDCNIGYEPNNSHKNKNDDFSFYGDMCAILFPFSLILRSPWLSMTMLIIMIIIMLLILMMILVMILNLVAFMNFLMIFRWYLSICFIIFVIRWCIFSLFMCISLIIFMSLRLLAADFNVRHQYLYTL